MEEFKVNRSTVAGNILTVLVGSKAHGLDTPTSDIDIRGVYVAPTQEILKINGVVSDRVPLVIDGE